MCRVYRPVMAAVWKIADENIHKTVNGMEILIHGLPVLASEVENSGLTHSHTHESLLLTKHHTMEL